MNADGSNIRRIAPFTIDTTDPHWSPNGKRLLFSTYAHPVQFKSANLFTMRADGTHRVALTHYAGGTLQAFADGWSPNGKQVVFHRMAYSGSHTEVGGFYVLNLSLKHIINTSKRIRRLTPVRLRSTKGSNDENTSFGFWPSGFPAPDNVSFPYLGPTIEAQRGNPVSMTVTNKLYQEGLDPSAPAECQALGLRVIHPLASYFDPTIEGDGAAERVRAANGHASPRRPHSGCVRRRTDGHLPPGDRRRQERLRSRDRVVHLRVPERSGGHDPLVPRPRPGRHAVQPDGRPGRLLPRPRPVGHRPARQPARPTGERQLLHARR